MDDSFRSRLAEEIAPRVEQLRESKDNLTLILVQEVTRFLQDPRSMPEQLTTVLTAFATSILIVACTW